MCLVLLSLYPANLLARSLHVQEYIVSPCEEDRKKIPKEFFSDDWWKNRELGNDLQDNGKAFRSLRPR